MALYLISYDLDKPEQNYTGLLARLRELKAQRCLYSEWFLVNTATPEAIRNDLQRFTDANDRMFVVELKNNAAWDRLMITNEVAQSFFKSAV